MSLRRSVLLLFAFLLAVAPPLTATFADPTIKTMDQPLADPALEAKARALMREIRCVVCQSQSIDESDADIAANLRNIVREQMAAGKTDDEIRDYLTARYGDFVLMNPPFKAETLALWIGPFALAAIGLGAGFATLRRNRAAIRAHGPRDLSGAEREKLQRLLAEGESGGGGA